MSADDITPDGLPLPQGAMPHPDHPGWYWWGEMRRGTFAAATGLMIFRPEAPGQARVRMFPEQSHLNMGGSIHGGAVMSFIDMSLFSGGYCAGMSSGHYVTLEMNTRFLARGHPDVPLDAVVRLVRETRGGLVFVAGHCEQAGEACYDFTGTLKRIRQPVKTDAGPRP